MWIFFTIKKKVIKNYMWQSLFIVAQLFKMSSKRKRNWWILWHNLTNNIMTKFKKTEQKLRPNQYLNLIKTIYLNCDLINYIIHKIIFTFTRMLWYVFCYQ